MKKFRRWWYFHEDAFKESGEVLGVLFHCIVYVLAFLGALDLLRKLNH